MLPRFVPSCFLFRGMVRNGIPRVCFYFSSTERNSELFLFRWRVRKGIPRVCFLFLVHGTEFRVVFSSAEGFGTKFRDFLFREIAGIPSEITLCSVYSVFRGIIFLSEIPNPRHNCMRLQAGTAQLDPPASVCGTTGCAWMCVRHSWVRLDVCAAQLRLPASQCGTISCDCMWIVGPAQLGACGIKLGGCAITGCGTSGSSQLIQK